MDALELKLSLIEQLKTIDDVKLLTQIKKFDQHSNRKERNALSGTDDAGRIKGSVEEIERRIQKRIRYDNGRIT